MVQKIHVSRNLAGLEDLLLGVGTVTQMRGGVTTTLTRIHAGALPFDETQNLETRLANIDAAAAIVGTYGTTLNILVANIDALLAITQVEIIGNTGNAATLEGQTLAQVRSGINATLLEGQTLAQVRSNIDAATLQGSSLAQARSGINAALLEGQTLAQVRSNIDAATLEGQTLAQVKEGGNAATLGGKTLAEVLVSASIVDADSATKGKVRIPTSAEAKAGTTTAAVPTVADVATHPSTFAAWGTIRMQKSSGNATVTATVTAGYGINFVSVDGAGNLSVTFNNNLVGFATAIPSGTYSGGTINTRQSAGAALNGLTANFSYADFFSTPWSTLAYNGDVTLYLTAYGVVQ